MLPPLVFTPIIKRLRWGGTRLATVLGKNIGQACDAAESWDIVDHGKDQSEVVTGEFRGWTLNRLVAELGEELLGVSNTQTSFPLLVKYLDAQDRLSLQVHPDDVRAPRYVPGERGKTEAWVILEAQPESLIYAGLKDGIDETELRTAISRGNLPDCVHSFKAREGDCIYIPAGTVHAIGEGILLVEIQQTSDLTFRLHDWGRVGSDGLPRPLHIEQALQCVDYLQEPVHPVVPRRRTSPNGAVEELISSPHFQLRRYSGTGSWQIETEGRFQILNILKGAVRLQGPDSEIHRSQEVYQQGATLLIPASCEGWKVIPQSDCRVLETR